ncbi:hypothetical protein [Kribbella sp. NPDC004875]|uniref:hypothetical protein n=1 Tax=Kribbella sp. NPDC004875 TaxID=3364107 RepID=UPI0036C6C198
MTRLRTATLAGVLATLSTAMGVVGVTDADAKSPEPIRRNAIARHSFDIPTAADKVRQLSRTTSTWAGDYAGDITFIHPGDHSLVVLVSDHVNEIYDRVPAAFKPFVTVSLGGVADMAGSPADDRGGWTGGNWIDGWNSGSSSSGCTEGFTWRTWGGAVLGSTAKHCVAPTSSDPYNDWSNNGRWLGKRSQDGTGTLDVTLMNAVPRYVVQCEHLGSAVCRRGRRADRYHRHRQRGGAGHRVLRKDVRRRQRDDPDARRTAVQLVDLHRREGGPAR